MKKNYIKLIYTMLAFLLTHQFAHTQCTNGSAYGTATAPASGSVTISTCQYQTEYSTISGVVAGNTYTSTYSGGGFITVRSGTSGGAVVASGNSPLTWTATIAGTYYVHYNTNSGCGTATSCLTSTIAFVSSGGGGGGGACGAAINMPTSGNCTTCGSTFYDSGGSGGNYLNNENRTYTICPSTPGAKVRMVFSAFALENNWDYMYIYDGNSTAAPSLGVYTGAASPGTVQATPSNASGCITIRFTSDGSGVLSGWAAAVSCASTCQTITANWVSSNPAPQADAIIRTCQGQSINFVGSGTFSSSNAGAVYTWHMGNGATVTGTNINYTYPTGGGYTVNLIITDPNGCSNNNRFNRKVEVSTTPTIATTATPAAICLGQTSALSATPTMTTYNGSCTPPVAGTTFLPDGSGVSYTTSIPVNCYAPAATITSGSQIQNICMSMEHSYLGDLQIRIICPNGQSSILKAYADGGGGTYLGAAIDDVTSGPGTGANYCFTPTATTLMVSGATTTAGSPAGASIIAGNYMPTQSFNNLVGCPLNGNWTIEITDNLSLDDGYIFTWDINFANTLLTLDAFTPTITSQGWMAATGLTTTGTTTANVTPSTAGTPCYTYRVIDNFGCTYTQNQCVTVNAIPTASVAGTNTICAGQSTTLTAAGGGTYNWSTGATGASLTVSPAATTTYTVTVTNASGCTATATRTVTVNSTPVPAIAGTNTICAGQSTTLTASGATNYAWNTGAVTAAISVSPASTTTYTVTAANGSCTATTTRTVTVNPVPTPSVAGTNTICAGQTSTFTAAGGSSYVWSTGAVTAAISVSTAGTYTVTATNAAGCTATATRTLTVNALPTASISGTTTICNGIPTILTASGGVTYVWSTAAVTAAISVSPAVNTTYSVTATNAAGCTGTASSNVTVNTVSTAPTIVGVAGTVCPNTNVTLTASGGTAGTGSVINWYSGPNGTGTLLGTGGSITIAPTGTMTVYARREGTCNNTVDAFTVVNTKTYIYATNGMTSNTYCTDNAGWHHFYIGDNIIYSVQGNLSAVPAGFPRATIYVNGTYYQNAGVPATICASGVTPGEERFEMARSWDLNFGGGTPSGTYNIRFYYVPTERTAIENAAIAWMAAYPACGYTYKYATPLGFYWFKNSGAPYSAPLYDATHYAGTGATTFNGINYAQWAGIPSFSGGSGAVIIVPNTLLPVEWQYFTGATHGRVNKLEWATGSEENTDYFEVQRSKDGANFEVIGNVAAAGSSQETSLYSFDDVNPFTGLNYYRLRLVSKDGTAEISEVVVLEIEDKGNTYTFYPNPAQDEVFYQYTTDMAEDLQMEVLDVLGRVLSNKNVKAIAGGNNLRVDMSNLVPGSYMVRVTHIVTGVVHSAKIIKK